MRTATYSKHFHTLEYFETRNTTRLVNCYGLEEAKRIIERSGIEQELHTDKRAWKFVPVQS
jgi:hypothetical protein